MGFVGLKLVLHDNPLLEKIRQSRHDDGIEHVDLQEESVANVEAVEGHALDEGDSGHISRVVTILIAPIADRQSMINGEVKAIDVGAHLEENQ